MNSATAQNQPVNVWIPFYTPIPRALKRVEAEFNRGARVIRVRGFPLNIYCVREPEDNVSILRDREVGETKLPALLPRVKRVMRGGGYILEGGSAWRERRRQIQEGFRSDYLKRYVDQIPELVSRTARDWQARIGADGTTINISKAMRDLITAANLTIFFSVDASGERLDRIAEQTHFVEHRLLGLLPLWVPTPTNLKFNRCVHALRREFLEIFSTRARRSPDGPQDLLSVLLRAKNPSTGAPWTMDEMIDEAFSVFFGASVVAVSLTWGLYLLARAPDLQEAARKEIGEWFRSAPGDEAGLVTHPACDALVKEVLRMYPASWGYPRYCRNGMELAGVAVPAGSVVIPMIEQAHYHVGIWQEPMQFCPRRFTTESGTHAVSRHAHLPFGMGTRMCLGANLAPMILKVVLGTLLRDFKFELPASDRRAVQVDYGFEIHPEREIQLGILPVSAT